MKENKYTKSEFCDKIARMPLFHKDRIKTRELDEDSLPMTMKEAGICVYKITGHKELKGPIHMGENRPPIEDRSIIGIDDNAQETVKKILDKEEW